MVTKEGQRKVDMTRYTVDLPEPQHRFMKRFALDNGVKASSLMRTLLSIMEIDIRVVNGVIDQIYSEVQLNDENKATGVDYKVKTVRYTVDLPDGQHRFLRRFALDNGIRASSVMKALLAIMESDLYVANLVIDEVYGEVILNDM